MATTMTTTMNTTTGTILLPPTPPQTPPLEAKKPSPTTITLSPSLPPSASYFDIEKTPQPQPPNPSTFLSPALPIPASPSTTFVFEKVPPTSNSQPSQSLLDASSRLLALGWKSRPRQGPQGDCRQLQKPNRSLAIPTLLAGGVPSVIVHGPKCKCKEREERMEKVGDDELAARVFVLAQRSVVRERIEEQRRIAEKRQRKQEKRERSAERRKKGVFGWNQVSRFFNGSSTSLSDSESDSESSSTSGSSHQITDLCLACSNLDIEKMFTYIFTNAVSVPINGRCTITSSDSEDAQPVETTPLFSVLRSPFFATRPKSQIAILRLLLDLGADANSSVSVLPLSFESPHLSSQAQTGRITALSTASILGLPEAVPLLLQHGAKLDARETSLPIGVDGQFGKALSALVVAILSGQERTVEVLLRAGASVTGSCELFLPSQLPTKLAVIIGGRPRLRSASTANFHTRQQHQGQHLQVPQLHMQERQEPQWPSLSIACKPTRLSNITPLHLSSLSGNLAISSMIMSSPYSKADTNARTSSSGSLTGGRSPLHFATEQLNLEVSSLLISDPCTEADAGDDEGATPLSLLVGKLGSNASMRQREEVVELVRRLLRAGTKAGVRYGTDMTLKARLLAMDDESKKWEGLFEEDGRGVLRGSMKRRTF